jgi:hypothetical protein
MRTHYKYHLQISTNCSQEKLKKAAKKQDAKLDKLKETWTSARDKPEKGKGKKGKAARA